MAKYSAYITNEQIEIPDTFGGTAREAAEALITHYDDLGQLLDELGITGNLLIRVPLDEQENGEYGVVTIEFSGKRVKRATIKR